MLRFRRFECAVLALAAAGASLALSPSSFAADALARRPARLSLARPAAARPAAPAPAPHRASEARHAAPAGAPVIVATKTHKQAVDHDTDDRVDPGDTIEYRIHVANTGGGDATGVAFDDKLDPSTSLDGPVNVSPLAFDDAYATVGNTLLEVGVPAGAAPAVRVPGSVLDNDVEFLADSYTLTGWDAASDEGGTVAMNGDGTFTYLPPAGFSGADHFTYTIEDGAGLTSVGRVTVSVGERVWYVDADVPPGGDGRSTSPLDGLASLDGAGGAGDLDAAGDILYLHEAASPYIGGLELENGQRLIGAGVALVADPGTGAVTLAPAGTTPTLTSTGETAVALASGNTVRGLDVTATGGAGIAGAAAGTLVMNALTVATVDGLALDIAGAALDATLQAVGASNSAGGGVRLQTNTGSIAIQSLLIASTGGTGFLATSSGTVTVTGSGNQIATTGGTALSITGTTIGAAGFTLQSLTATGGASGIVLQNTGSLAGLAVTGTGAASSGGSISGATGDAISLSGVRSLSLTDFRITGSGGNHIDAATVSHGLTLTRLFADQAGSDGVRAVGLLGSSQIASSTITRSAGINLHVLNSTATVASPGAPDLVAITGSTITNTLASASGSSGIRFEGTGTANLRLTLGTSTVSDNRIDGLDVRAQNGSRVDVRVSGTAFTGNLGSAINVASTQTATAIADVRGLDGLRSNLNVINFIGFDTAVINATVDDVEILESTTGSGIRAIQEGNGTVTAQFTNNRISGIAQAYGIVCQARAGTGTLNLDIVNNIINNTASGMLVLEGINVESGSSAGGDANTVCLDLANNSSAVSVASGQEGYRLRQRAGTTFLLQNFAGNGANAADVGAWIAGKGNTGTSQILIGTAFSSSAACPTPPPLPTVVAEPAAAAIDAAAPPPGAPLAAGALEAGTAPLAGAALAAPASFAPATDVPVTIGTLPAGKQVTIVFRVAVAAAIAGGAKTVANQGSVSGSNFSTVLTDDPATTDPADPTVTPIDDTLMPQVEVVDPNGGEVVMVGSNLKIEWTATDNLGVTSVDIRLSRDLGATWEDIVLGVANSGTYTWQVTPPASNQGQSPVHEALIEVRARDANGNVGADSSDAPFAIFDTALETLLSLFEAAPVAEGIELRWRVAASLRGALALERAPEPAGPWARVPGTVRTVEETFVLTDATVEPGRTYHYRLAGLGAGGEPLVFGPLQVTVAAAAEFALGAIAPNPSRGPTRIDLSVPREAPVRVTIVDLQGREVAVLIDRTLRAGRYQAVWSGEAGNGPAPAGVYFVRYRSTSGTLTRRIVLAR